MVRLVFRPYTQFRRSICTSESLRTSIRVSPDFVLTRHSSPSFGSQRVRSGCASTRDENETPRGCGAGDLTVPDPSPLGRRWAGLHFHFACRFSVVPMTRAHARLLGPCFKTGPESTQSYGVADRRGVCPRRPPPAAARSRRRHWVRNARGAARARGGPDANAEFRGPTPRCPPSGGRAGRTRVPPDEPRGSPTGLPPVPLRPAPDGSRRPTRGEVHAFGRSTDADRDRTLPGERDDGRRTRVPAVALRDAVESPPSTFRVSQVYP